MHGVCTEQSCVIPCLAVHAALSRRKVFPQSSLQLRSKDPRAAQQMRRDGERWKPWERQAVGRRLQKLHGNFKGFFILDAALTISEEYPALSLRTILKQVCARTVWGRQKFPTYKPLPSEDGDGVSLMSVVESACLLVNVSRCVEGCRDSDHTEVLSWTITRN